jgi:hypothetical protein
LNKTLKGGCFKKTNELSAKGNSNTISKDTLQLTFSKDTLKVNLGLNLNCCASLIDSVVVQDNKITAFINDTSKFSCKCLCYYTYDFSFIQTSSRQTYICDIKYKDQTKKEYTTILKDTI